MRTATAPDARRLPWAAPGRIAGLAALLASAAALAAPSAPRIRYTVRLEPPVSGRPGRTRVEMEVDGLTPGRAQGLCMPSWTPGDYRLQNHWRGVTAVTATEAGGGEAPIRRVERDLWEVAPRSSAVRVRYTVPNQEPGLFSENALVSERHAYLSGPAVLMFALGRLNEPHGLRVEAPEGWRAPLCPLEAAPGPSGGFTAPDYDALVDAPILAGEREESAFLEAGVRVTVATFGGDRPPDAGAFAARFRPIVAAAVAMMGSAPGKRYTLFVDGDGRGGGLEHADAARIGWIGPASPAFSALAAHEFLHAWNVKRLRPAGMLPYDYRVPLRCRTLWFAEGVTEYLSRLVLYRSGQATRREMLEGLAADIAQYEATPAASTVSAEEAGYRVWEGGGSAGYGGLSYYLKGELIGLCLDAAIRQATNGARGLEDLLRGMLPLHSPPRPGYTPADLRERLVALAGAKIGPDYDALTTGTGPMPFDWAAAALGLRLARARSGLTLAPDPEAAPEARARLDAWLWGGPGAAERVGREDAPSLPVNLGATCPASIPIAPRSRRRRLAA